MSKLLNTRDECVAASRNLTACLEDGADEDAYEWALNILRGIHRIKLTKLSRLQDAVRTANDDG